MPKTLDFMNINMFPIVEIFGPTIQGEGPLIGSRCIFIRFAGCDSDCHWCDTRYAWDKKEPRYGYQQMSAREIVEYVVELGPEPCMVVLTGGNPALQENMGELLHGLKGLVTKVVVETQGTKFQPWFNDCDYVVVSPKLSNARLTKSIDSQQVLEVLGQINCDVITHLKIVVFNAEDVEEALREYYIPSILECITDFTLQVGTLPGDAATWVLERWLYITNTVLHEYPKATQVRVLPQAHVLLWGHGRGF